MCRCRCVSRCMCSVISLCFVHFFQSCWYWCCSLQARPHGQEAAILRQVHRRLSLAQENETSSRSCPSESLSSSVWFTDIYINKLDTGLPSLSITKCEPLKLTSPAQHASRWRMREQPNLSSALLVASWQDAKMTQYYVALEFMLGNSGTKLPTQCMLGRRGEFEGLANWLSVLPLWSDYLLVLSVWASWVFFSIILCLVVFTNLLIMEFWWGVIGRLHFLTWLKSSRLDWSQFTSV